MDGQKIIIFMICINVMLYLFGFVLIDGDILTKFMDTSGMTTTGDTTDIKFNTGVTGSIPTDITTSGASSSNPFIDGLAMIWGTFLLLINLLTSPVAIFTRFLHPVIAILIGLPFAFMYLLAIIKFIRGADF